MKLDERDTAGLAGIAETTIGPPVTLEVEGADARLTIDRPSRGNAMDLEMAQAHRRDRNARS